MADLRQHEALVEQVAKARKEASRRPDLKLPTGRLNQIGQHVYAYSGSLEIDNNETVMIEDTTTTDYIVGTIQFNNLKEDDVEDYLHYVYLNGVVVQGFIQGRTDYDNKYESVIPILIPPFTTFKLTSQNITNTESHAEVASLVGEAYTP